MELRNEKLESHRDEVLKMWVFAVSAAFVGLVHSLAPGHWLPVVLMSKSRRWPVRTALLGALVTALGHVMISLALGLAMLELGAHFLSDHEEGIERMAGLGVALFGLAYAAFSYRRHSHCHGHEHHGPTPNRHRAPFVFLFTVGLSPCVAVLPVFAAAAPVGSLALIAAMAGFVGGVLVALLSATGLASLGAVKFDHPVFEHHGDAITGLGVALMGLILFIHPDWLHLGV
jgi:nickel/cobalt exporter